MRQVGMLLSGTADDAVFQTWVGAFLQGLAQSGWTIGRDVRIETRWAGSKADDIRRHAHELAALAPDAILAHGGSTVRPLMQSTRSQRGLERRTHYRSFGFENSDRHDQWLNLHPAGPGIARSLKAVGQRPES
jgi:hypothetical protein